MDPLLLNITPFSEGLPFFGNYTPKFPSEPPPASTEELVLFAVLYTIIICVGVIGNSGLLLALLSSHGARVRTPLLVSLCMADLLVCCCSAPLAAIHSTSLSDFSNITHVKHLQQFTVDAAPCEDVRCVAFISAEAFPITASTLSLMMLSVDRYITVQHPRCLSELQGCPHSITLLVWLAATLLTSPVIVAPEPALLVARVILVFLLPSSIVFICHLGVRSKLCALSLTARAAHGELPLPVPLMRRPTHVIIVAGMANQTQAVTYGYDDEEKAEWRKRRNRPSGGPIRGGELKRKRDPSTPPEPSLLAPQPQTSTLQSRRRLANVLVSVAAVFAACWLPYAASCLHVLIEGGSGDNVIRLLRYSILLGHAHSAINPAVYWILNHQTLSRGNCTFCPDPAAARRFLFHFKLHDDQPPSSTNEAALGAFHPRYSRPPKIERAPPSSHYLY